MLAVLAEATSFLGAPAPLEVLPLASWVVGDEGDAGAPVDMAEMLSGSTHQHNCGAPT